MTIQIPQIDFAPEQRMLWEHVVGLWELSRGRSGQLIRSLLHPDYVGWDMSTSLPHERDDAVRSASRDSPELREYTLRPLSVQLYDGNVGIVHYTYSANVVPRDGSPIDITGKWTEVYLRQEGAWIMLSVSGRPDPQDDAAGDIRA